MTVVVKGEKSIFLATQPLLLDDSRDVADSWASKFIIPNKAIKWVLGKYVEADKANKNGQYWSLDDLVMKSPTIHHAPMNINHIPKKIVGTYVAAELMHPVSESAGEQPLNPYIETVAAFWKPYNPDLLDRVEAAFEEGSLFQSMECVSETVTCMAGCGDTFAYAGPVSESYCTHLNSGGVRSLDNPHFLAGALIIPPISPGWDGAVIEQLIKANAETAEDIYNQVSTEAPHLEARQWEEAMAQILVGVVSEEEKVTARTLGRLVSLKMS